jgi:hypothetical protein
MIALVEQDTIRELVTHVELLIRRHDDGWKHVTNDSIYSSARLKEILRQPPFDLKRFSIRKSWWGTYRIWDANKNGHWSFPMTSREFKTREYEWAVEKMNRLNDEHQRTYAAWREEGKTDDHE